MEWKRIPKEKSKRPDHGSKYGDWKEELAVEGFNQCVYCAIKESAFGGIRNFHVEHFKPKSIFPELANDYSNLYYACSICNYFKSNDWPNGSSKNALAYVNPSLIDYSTIFKLNGNGGSVKGVDISASYMVERLYLNRPQLILERKQYIVKEKIWREIDKVNELKTGLYKKIDTNKEAAVYFLKEIDNIISKILSLIKITDDIIPYSLSQTKR